MKKNYLLIFHRSHRAGYYIEAYNFETAWRFYCSFFNGDAKALVIDTETGVAECWHFVDRNNSIAEKLPLIDFMI